MYDYYEMIRQQQETNTKLQTIINKQEEIIENQENIYIKITSINDICGAILLALFLKIIWDFVIRCWK